MDQSQLESVVISVIKEIQELSGRNHGEISSTTRPLADLENFDSLNAVEATIALGEKLGIDLNTNNMLIDEDGKTELNISEIAHRLSTALKVELKP